MNKQLNGLLKANWINENLGELLTIYIQLTDKTPSQLLLYMFIQVYVHAYTLMHVYELRVMREVSYQMQVESKFMNLCFWWDS